MDWGFHNQWKVTDIYIVALKEERYTSIECLNLINVIIQDIKRQGVPDIDFAAYIYIMMDVYFCIMVVRADLK